MTELVSNWHGRPVAVTKVARPESEQDVRSLVRETDGPVRAVGNRYSRTGLLVPATSTGTLLDVSRIQGFVKATPDTVTFGAGTPLGQVYEILQRMGRMLPCSPPVISAQTAAGAIATGTHGQGLKQSSLSDVVTNFRIVDDHGEAWECNEAHPLFGALQLNLGCLGIVTEVTLRTIPSTRFTCLKSSVSTEELLTHYERWNREFEFCKVWWFPESEKAHMWRVQGVGDDEARRADDGRPRSISGGDSSLNHTVGRLAERMRRDTKAADEGGDQFRTIERFKDFTSATGDIYELLCKGIPVPQINVEIAVPLKRFESALRRIGDLCEASETPLHYPVIVRSSGPSSSWLSPSYDQESAYFGLVAYRADDGSVPGGIVELLRGLEAALACEQGRPHWGKYFSPNLYDWPRIYPRWDDYRQAKQALDGRGRFGNTDLDELFSGAVSRTFKAELAV